MVSPIPEKQKALWLPKALGKFEVGEADVPQPGPGEVLVREEAVGLNPVDYVTQTTGMFATEYPVIIGWEGAGVVVGLGEGVQDVSIGDRVYVVLHYRAPYDTEEVIQVARRACWTKHYLAGPCRKRIRDVQTIQHHPCRSDYQGPFSGRQIVSVG